MPTREVYLRRIRTLERIIEPSSNASSGEREQAKILLEKYYQEMDLAGTVDGAPIAQPTRSKPSTPTETSVQLAKFAIKSVSIILRARRHLQAMRSL